MTGGPEVERLPVPMGVIAETGATHPQLTALPDLGAQSAVVLARSGRRKRALAIEGAVDDPMDLSQAGWCALFASDAHPAVREALAPLLELRREQVGAEKNFKVFAGAEGVKPGETAAAWAARKEVSLVAPVSPRKGVPFYMLIVGGPDRIPFEFQAQFDLQWAVGRLCFDRVEDYAAYARKIVDHEKGLAPPRRKLLSVWIPRNPLDVATPLLAGSIVPEFLGRSTADDMPIGRTSGFEISTFVGDGQATRSRLDDIMRGRADGGPPAILFTGSHGAEWTVDDPAVQRERQGALVTQEWTRGRPLLEGHYYAGDDVPHDAQVHGMMAFLFACFGGGCPDLDSYYFQPDGQRKLVAPRPFVARLPQRLLARGALAIIAHVDRAFSYAFEDVMGTSQAQLLRQPLERLARGHRVGLAADPLNLQWSALAAQLGVALGGAAPGTQPARSPLIANLYIARDDARNYVVLGDPAVRLRTESMA
jgi:hypothetical protein